VSEIIGAFRINNFSPFIPHSRNLNSFLFHVMYTALTILQQINPRVQLQRLLPKSILTSLASLKHSENFVYIIDLVGLNNLPAQS